MTVAIAGIVPLAALVAVQVSAADPVRRKVRQARVVDPSAAADPVDPVPPAVLAVMAAARSVAMAVRDVVPKVFVRRRPHRCPSSSSRSLRRI